MERRRARIDPYEPRVLGLPRSWFGLRSTVETREVRHPIRWSRWRLQVRGLGPYAPTYEQWSAARKGTP